MSNYICEKCGCIEKTDGGGNYWNVKANQNLFAENYANKELLCRFCVPKNFSDGERYKEAFDEINKRHEKRVATLNNKNQVIKRDNPENAETYFKMLEARR